MYDLIDRAEWKSHRKCVAELLPRLKNAVYDADDLLDEFGWYNLKIQVENSSSQSPNFGKFYDSIIQGSFSKVVGIKRRLDNLSGRLEKTGLYESAQKFDKSVRPVTTSFPTEKQILFGRMKELNGVMKLLGVPSHSIGPKRKQRKSEARTGSVPVLPIVGMGGIGKTTLAQEISRNQAVKSHFDKIIWVCVSDDFNVERLIKEVVNSFPAKEANDSNLDSLQRVLEKKVNKSRFLLILADMWSDALKYNRHRWNQFCAPFANAVTGSMMLVTTRLPEVTRSERSSTGLVPYGGTNPPGFKS